MKDKSLYFEEHNLMNRMKKRADRVMQNVIFKT